MRPSASFICPKVVFVSLVFQGAVHSSPIWGLAIKSHGWSCYSLFHPHSAMGARFGKRGHQLPVTAFHQFGRWEVWRKRRTPQHDAGLTKNRPLTLLHYHIFPLPWWAATIDGLKILKTYVVMVCREHEVLWSCKRNPSLAATASPWLSALEARWPPNLTKATNGAWCESRLHTRSGWHKTQKQFTRSKWQVQLAAHSKQQHPGCQIDVGIFDPQSVFWKRDGRRGWGCVEITST